MHSTQTLLIVLHSGTLSILIFKLLFKWETMNMLNAIFHIYTASLRITMPAIVEIAKKKWPYCIIATTNLITISCYLFDYFFFLASVFVQFFFLFILW